MDWITTQGVKGPLKAPMKPKVKVRPYKRDNTVWQVDVKLIHPHTSAEVRKRPLAPAGFSEEQARAWGEEQAMVFYLELCKGTGEAPKIDSKKKEEPERLNKKPARVPTLAEVWPDFESEHISALKIATQAGYKAAWRTHIRPALGELPLDMIDKSALSRLVKAMGRAKKSSIRQIIVRVTTCLGWAKEAGKLPENHPIPTIKWKTKKTDPPIYSREELELLLGAARDHDDRVLLLLLIDGALRIGECAGLMWSDVDLAAGSMKIQRNVSRTVLQDTPKGEVGTIKLTPRLAEALRRQRAIRKGRFVLVPKLRKAEHASDFVLGHVVNFLQRKAGLPVYGAHRIRHSVLSLLARAGVTPYALQALARHAHLSTTMSFYIHLKKAELAAEAISALSLPAPTDPGNGQATAANTTPRHLPRLNVM